MLTTVCVLLYGDYPDLARRVLLPLRALFLSGDIHLRIGCNDISSRSRDVLEEIFPQICGGLSPRQSRTTSVGVNKKSHIVFSSEESEIPEFMVQYRYPQIFKYPMMRELFDFNGSWPIKTPFTMWFDDDSCITAEDPSAWLKDLIETIQVAKTRLSLVRHIVTVMAGSIYKPGTGFSESQCKWLATRSWVNRPPRPGHKTSFCTGGWWVIDTEFLRTYDWPDPDIRHRGGDVMLGELISQQNCNLLTFRRGIAINADEALRESRSRRRGFDEPPVGTETPT